MDRSQFFVLRSSSLVLRFQFQVLSWAELERRKMVYDKVNSSGGCMAATFLDGNKIAATFGRRLPPR